MAKINPQNFPVGIRFTPSDQELLVYLKNKNHGLPQPIDLIHEYNIYTCRPDQLPRNFFYGKGNELYFFVTRDLTKSRMPRNVENGYGFWRSTGNIELVRDQDHVVIGKKRTFNFFKCKPKREKTNWVMKESSLIDPTSYEGAEMKKVGFVLCKIYENKKASDENQDKEEQMTEMSVGDGPNNSDSDAVTENFEESTSLTYDENQMTEMPPGDGPNNPDPPSFGCHASMGDLLPPSEENQITEMPLRVGPNNPDFLSSEFIANMACWFQDLEENQITEMPLGDNPNNPNFPHFGYASMEIPEENQMTEIPLGHCPDNLDFLCFVWDANMVDSFRTFPQMTEMSIGDGPNNSDSDAVTENFRESTSLPFDENQMTKIPPGDGPNNPDLPSFGCHASMGDLLPASEENQITEMPLRVGPNNPDFLSSECDANIEDWLQEWEENQITEMPLGDNPNNPNFSPFEYASMEIPEENQMTEITLGHGPDNLDFLPFGCDANMEDSFRTFPQMTEMLQGDYPNNADFTSFGCDINMEDPFSTSEESQMTGMPLGDVRNNSSYTPSWGNMVNQVTEMSSDRVWKISS